MPWILLPKRRVRCLRLTLLLHHTVISKVRFYPNSNFICFERYVLISSYTPSHSVCSSRGRGPELAIPNNIQQDCWRYHAVRKKYSPSVSPSSFTSNFSIMSHFLTLTLLGASPRTNLSFSRCSQATPCSSNHPKTTKRFIYCTGSYHCSFHWRPYS